MLRDSAHIQEKDAEWLNRRERRGSADRLEPLYGRADADAVMELFVRVEYGARFSPFEGVDVEYHDAGHMLGSASMTLKLSEGGSSKMLGFTGDVGRPNSPILRDPQPMPDCDWLICESTYGGRMHEAPEEAKDHLLRVVAETVGRGGKVIVPAFAVGRTQEIVHRLDQLTNEGKLPKIPIFVDSPLSVRITDIFKLHPECFDEETRAFLQKNGDPFGFDTLTYVSRAEDSKALNGRDGPLMIIAGSGMCEAGRILHHLRHGLEDERNMVLIIGYQAPHTLGRQIADGRQYVRIFDREYPLKAKVEKLEGLSAHADVHDFKWWFERMSADSHIGQAFLVHGEPDAAQALAGVLRDLCDEEPVVPQFGESFDV
jgi:metallo-beta-lactamase family protein